ncbi:hypothetical protein [Streptomyces cinnamoneus]|uniref:Uncharacterized protein n=1 Tax=Streptomyces cinnamoneus TaxID=53446 RepID=A0A918WEC5_STRCJ|nr:hypothetical protein [Streptomyces cinnamoneus]GHC34351.1 hypothetical protein GCM10010507_03880 [Streptomyces cinnamoneus]
MGENAKDTGRRTARARQLHRLIDRLKAGEPPAAGAGAGTPGPGATDRDAPPNLREAVHRRMRELDEAERRDARHGEE